MFLETFMHMDLAVWSAVGLLALSFTFSVVRLCMAFARGRTI